MDRLGGEVRRELGRFGSGHAGMHDGGMAAIVRAWPGAVGETVARNAWPARLTRDGTLHVNTASSTWAFELGRLASTILDQLRQDLGEALPPALKFAPGPIPNAAAEAAEKRAQPRPAIAPEHRAEAAAIAAGIEDEELRKLVERAAAASLAGASVKPPADRRF